MVMHEFTALEFLGFIFENVSAFSKYVIFCHSCWLTLKLMRTTVTCAGSEKSFSDYSAVSAVKEHNHVSAGLASLASPPHPVWLRSSVAAQFHLNGTFSFSSCVRVV